MEIRNHQDRVRVDLPRLRKAAKALLKALGREKEVLSILVVDDLQMSGLHARWMGDPSPTDVLSFRMPAGPPPAVFGDVVISAEAAARRRPKAVRREILRCLVHGVLHLAGHDHLRARDRERMNREARRLTAAVGEVR